MNEIFSEKYKNAKNNKFSTFSFLAIFISLVDCIEYFITYGFYAIEFL